MHGTSSAGSWTVLFLNTLQAAFERHLGARGRWHSVAVQSGGDWAVPELVASVMEPLGVWWAIAGGWAIDLWLGRVTRDHHDVEVATQRHDQAVVHRKLAMHWDMFCIDPPGSGWRTWRGEEISRPSFQTKARLGSGEFDLFLEDVEARPMGVPEGCRSSSAVCGDCRACCGKASCASTRNPTSLHGGTRRTQEPAGLRSRASGTSARKLKSCGMTRYIEPHRVIAGSTIFATRNCLIGVRVSTGRVQGLNLLILVEARDHGCEFGGNRVSERVHWLGGGIPSTRREALWFGQVSRPVARPVGLLRERRESPARCGSSVCSRVGIRCG